MSGGWRRQDETAGAVFAALSDPTRRRVLRGLAAEGSATATQLAASMTVTRQAVAKHLAALADAGLVQASRSGREVRYRITAEPMTTAAGWMAEIGAEWDERLDALRRHLLERS